MIISVPRFRKKDILYIALCLAGAAVALWFFWQDLNLTLSHHHAAVGAVICKTNTAQRRFSDRTLWDRLRRESPVYSGDYIRTANLSGAALSLFGGDFLDLQENTLIQILPAPDGFTVELTEGELRADSGGGITIRTGEVSLQAQEASVLRAAVKNGALEAGVLEGSALIRQGEETRTLRAGEAFFLSSAQRVLGPLADKAGGDTPTLISPALNEEFSFSTTRPGLRFVWTSCEGAAAYRLEISADPSMANLFSQVQAQDSGGDTSSIVHSGFEEGTWYWRVQPEYPPDFKGAGQLSQTGSFRILRKGLETSTQLSPGQDSRLYLEDKKNDVYFSWKQEADAVLYTFLLSRNEDLSNPLIKQKSANNYFVYNLESGNLSPGQYYWGVYQTDINGNDSASSTGRSVFIMAGAPPERTTASAQTAPVTAVTEAAQPNAGETGVQTAPQDAGQNAGQPEPAAAVPPLPAPGNMRPAAGYTLTEEIIVRDKQIAFSWNAVAGASGYVFILYQAESGGRREVLRRTLSETRFTLTDLAVLDAGNFVWSVEPQARQAGQKSETGESSFAVSIGEVQAAQGRESGVQFGTE
jgi:hypothetical protein